MNKIAYRECYGTKLSYKNDVQIVTDVVKGKSYRIEDHFFSGSYETRDYKFVTTNDGVEIEVGEIVYGCCGESNEKALEHTLTCYFNKYPETTELLRALKHAKDESDRLLGVVRCFNITNVANVDVRKEYKLADSVIEDDAHINELYSTYKHTAEHLNKIYKRNLELFLTKFMTEEVSQCINRNSDIITA